RRATSSRRRLSSCIFRTPPRRLTGTAEACASMVMPCPSRNRAKLAGPNHGPYKGCRHSRRAPRVPWVQSEHRKSGMIILTGGAGFIGSNLLAALEERGQHEIVVCDRLGEGEKWRNLAKRELAGFVEPDRLSP